MPDERSQARVVLHRDGVELASWPLDLGGRVDLAIVDELARLRLTAHRLGFTVRLRHAPRELVDLLDLAGLACVVPSGCGPGADGAAGSVVEVGGQAEGGEERGVEEVVMPDDPVP
ncbi:MAG TPA: hypothetical protein VHM89_14815 [Acidimicrobiales bacterium]|nr:hypothetical protein [Acidimicrobiales bacterium]